MSVYVTIQNDRLDQICKRKYGTERGGNVELVLAANSGLAELPALYPAGMKIVLPEIPPAPLVKEVRRLWS